jgi:23S rRNA-/tRNA-specific pseudouridylate synthase
MEPGDQRTESGKPRVLAETPEWLVLFKPAGWLTIPGRAASGAKGAPPILSEWAAQAHGPIWIVHRLDRETSGVILLARTAEAHRQAGFWFQRHQVRKSYDLLALGAPRAPTVRIKEAIEGSPSVTQLECREQYEGCFLARALPLSGRRHQIRIHLAGEGHALLGDAQYGGPKEVARPLGEPLRVSRVALHAARLELPSGEVFEARWPEDFSAWVARLRGENGARA